MPPYIPPLIVVAPKGPRYSSITDEQFIIEQARLSFKELTLEEYCNWTNIKSSVLCRSTRVTPDDPQSDYNVSFTAGRYSSRFSMSDEIDPSFEDEELGFAGMYPGWLDAKKPFYSWFHISAEDFIASKVENSGSFIVANQTFLLQVELSLNILPFYHRDRFYIVWQYDLPSTPPARTVYSFEVSATKLALKTTINKATGGVASERIISYELQ